MTDKLPCQKIHYLHVVRGGAADGTETPSEHWYETLEINGEMYIRDGEPEPIEPKNWQVISCCDDYSETIWMKAPMRVHLKGSGLEWPK